MGKVIKTIFAVIGVTTTVLALIIGIIIATDPDPFDVEDYGFDFND